MTQATGNLDWKKRGEMLLYLLAYAFHNALTGTCDLPKNQFSLNLDTIPPVAYGFCKYLT